MVNVYTQIGHYGKEMFPLKFAMNPFSFLLYPLIICVRWLFG